MSQFDGGHVAAANKRENCYGVSYKQRPFTSSNGHQNLAIPTGRIVPQSIAWCGGATRCRPHMRQNVFASRGS